MSNNVRNKLEILFLCDEHNEKYKFTTREKDVLCCVRGLTIFSCIGIIGIILYIVLSLLEKPICMIDIKIEFIKNFICFTTPEKVLYGFGTFFLNSFFRFCGLVVLCVALIIAIIVILIVIVIILLPFIAVVGSSYLVYKVFNRDLEKQMELEKLESEGGDDEESVSE